VVKQRWILYEIIDELRTLISTLGAWQEWTGSATAEEAIAHIHLIEASSTLASPIIILDYAGDIAMIRQSGRVDSPWMTTATVVMYLRDSVAITDPVTPDNEVTLGFYNNMTGLLNGLQSSGWKPPRLCISSMVIRGMARTDEAKRPREGDNVESVTVMQLRCVS
jgi:hypothetical protein